MYSHINANARALVAERRRGAALLPLVRAGVRFKDGAQLERADQAEVEQVAEVAA